MERNVQIYAYTDLACVDSCRATIERFKAKGCALEIIWANLDDILMLHSQGHKIFPVVKLRREGVSWEGHQPARIDEYQPKLSEMKLTFRALPGPRLGVWRKRA